MKHKSYESEEGDCGGSLLRRTFQGLSLLSTFVMIGALHLEKTLFFRLKNDLVTGKRSKILLKQTNVIRKNKILEMN